MPALIRSNKTYANPSDPPGPVRPMSDTAAAPKPVVTVLTADDEAPPPGLDMVQARAQMRLATDTESLRASLPDSDILMVTDFRTEALLESWSAAKQLRWIHACSAGVDAVLTDDVKASEITVTNARGIFDRSIAEYVLGLILMFAKDSRRNIALQAARVWKHRDTESIAGKRVLVVGAGSIGRQIANICMSVGMRCDGVARSERDGDADFGRIFAQTDLIRLLPDYDYVVVSAPLTEQTRGLFDAEAYAAMPDHARFINIGRGPIVQTDALINALRNGHIAGAGLDVFEEEPLPENHPLWRMDNVFMSAHMAGDFLGWRRALTEQFVANLDHWLAGEALFNVVQGSENPNHEPE